MAYILSRSGRIGIKGLAAFVGRVDFGKRRDEVGPERAGTLLVDRQGHAAGVLDDVSDARSVFRFPYDEWSRRIRALRRSRAEDRVETFNLKL